jgi:hypothetical protein
MVKRRALARCYQPVSPLHQLRIDTADRELAVWRTALTRPEFSQFDDIVHWRDSCLGVAVSGFVSLAVETWVIVG